MKLNERGIIAVTVLWILAILGLFSVGLGQQASLELSLIKYEMEKFKGKYAGWGAIVYAMDKIVEDKADEATQQSDTLFKCGVALKSGETPEQLFTDIAIGDVKVDIGFAADIDGEGTNFYPGMQDETSRININLMTGQTYHIFSQLMMLMGVNENAANTIALSSIDWRDEDNELSDTAFGAEDNYYMGLTKQYHCKNRPFESVEELLLVKGMTPEIFAKIKDFVTIYPKQGNFVINLDTAPMIVLQALARGVTYATQTGLGTADGLSEKLISYRKGADGKSMTADDRSLRQAEISVSQEEQIIFLGMQTFGTQTANYLRITTTARTKESSRGISQTAVISREDLSFVHWHVN